MSRVSVRPFLWLSLTIGLLLAATRPSDATILVVPTDYATIANATAAALDGDTVLVEPGDYSEPIAYSGKGLTVQTIGSAHNTIVNGIILVLSDSSYISGFQVRYDGIVSNAMRVDGTGFLHVEDCRFEGRWIGDAIRTGGDATIEFHRSVFLNMASGNAMVLLGDNCRVINCTFDGSERGVAFIGANGELRNNILVGQTVYAVYASTNTNAIDHNDLWDNGEDYAGAATAGAHDIAVDPEFTVPEMGLYTLAHGSPCIDAGDPDPAYNDPDGSRNDLGAFPFPSLPVASVMNLGDESEMRVVSHTPIFHWEFFDTSGIAAGYELEVGTDNDWLDAELWSTGEVLSSDTSRTYAGSPLTDGEVYYWRLRVFNGSAWGDWRVDVFYMNQEPLPPLADRPSNGAVLPPQNVTLSVLAATDLDGDPLDYQFEVYGDSGLDTLVRFVSSSTVSSPVLDPLANNNDYWWRARSFDNHEPSIWTATRTFSTRKRTFDVPGDFPGIQAALDSLETGDTIMVAPGTYEDNLDWHNRGIAVQSAGGSAVTFLTPATTAEHLADLSHTPPGAVLQGFTIQHVEGTAPSCIEITGNAEPVVTGNVFYDISGYPHVIRSTISNAHVARNVFHEVDEVVFGILSQGGSFTNNTLVDCETGVTMVSSLPLVRNNIFTGMDVALSGSAAQNDYNLYWNNVQDVGPGAAAGGGAVFADPDFQSNVNSYFGLAPTSPCVDAGDPAAQYADPDGSRNDIGAIPLGPPPYVTTLHFGGENPVRLVSDIPTFYWGMIDGTPAGYHLQVGTDVDWAVAEFWDTGEVYSADTSVVYAGSLLTEGVTYYCRLRAFDGSAWSGWQLSPMRLNVAPEPPTPATPVNGAPANYEHVNLTVDNGVDADGDALQYDFAVYEDSQATIEVATITGRPEQTAQTQSGMFPPFDVPVVYWWRARVFDGAEYSTWSPVASFMTRGNAIVVPDMVADLPSAIDLAVDGDTILINPGEYETNVEWTQKAIHIIGSGGAEQTVLHSLDPNQFVVLVDSVPAEAEIAEITFQNIGPHPAIGCVAGTGVRIRDCRFIDNTTGSFPLIRCDESQPLIEHNLFVDNTGISCIGVYSGSATILNNTFDGNARGFFSLSGATVAMNNIVTNSEEYGIFGEFSTSYNNVWNNGRNYDGGAGPGSGSISLNPYYANPAGYSYTLLDVSPCIDAGNPDAVFNDHDATRNDMGALPTTRIEPFAIGMTLDDEDLDHVVATTPEFAWSVVDSAGEYAAFQLHVGADPTWATAGMWTSGVLPFADTSIAYAGPPLVDGTTYFWRVQLYDATDWGSWSGGRFRMNTVPTVPVLQRPADSASVSAANLSFWVENANDGDNDPLYYDYQVAADTTFAILTAAVSGVAETPDSTAAMNVDNLNIDQSYWWRARATDTFEHSAWSAPRYVHIVPVGSVNIPEDYPTIQEGIDNVMDYDTVYVSPGTYTQSFTFRGRPLVVMGADGPDVTVLNNTTATVNFVNGEGPSSVLTGFTITGIPDFGPSAITIAGNSSPTIIGNVFHDNYVDLRVITVQGGQPLIKRNVFYSNGGISCIGVDGGAPRIINNTFDRNYRGFYSNSSGTVAINNIVTNSLGYGIFGSYATLTYNNVFGNQTDYIGPTPGVGSISADPEYLDPLAGDYGLRANSPCINAGNPDPAYNDPDGTRADIGARQVIEGVPYVALIAVDTTGHNQHIINSNPLIQWDYGIRGGGTLVASDIQIGTDLDWSVAELWNRTQIPAPTTSLLYSGEPLVRGNTYYIRIRVRVDTTWSEWRSSPIEFNTIPTTPVTSLPSNGSAVGSTVPQLKVVNATDDDGDNLTYSFEVYLDSALTELYAEGSGIEQFGGTYTAWYVNPPLTEENQPHWWRARAHDGYEYGEWSSVSLMFLDALSEPPNPAALVGPESLAVIYPPAPVLQWETPTDPDPLSEIDHFDATVGLTPGFALSATIEDIADTQIEWPDTLPHHITYYWKVESFDNRGLSSVSGIWSFRITDYGDLNRDETLDAVDLYFLIQYLFFNGTPPEPLWSGDVNGDCVSDAQDMVYLINLVFFNGPAAVHGCE